MSRRVKQVMVDTLEDGKPWAVRVISFREISDPDGPEETVTRREAFEVPYADLDKKTQAQVRGLLKKAATLSPAPPERNS